MKKKTTAKKKSTPVQAKPKLKSVHGNESFFESVYDVARLIPRGRVTSYGAIASYLGTKLSARMVGWAMNGAGKIMPAIPAHRVVNKVGMLSGKVHFGSPKAMENLLKKEGIKVKNDMIVDFEKLFWDPVKELEI